MSTQPEVSEKSSMTLTKTDVTTLIQKLWPDSKMDLLNHQLIPYSNQKLGFMADHCSVILEVKDTQTNQKQTRKLFMKAKPQNSLRAMLDNMQGFEKEIIFYTQLLPLMSKDFVGDPWAPKGYMYFDSGLIVEDLREKGFAMHGKLLSLEEMTSSLETLARMHAASILTEEKLGKPLNEVFPQAFDSTFFFEDGAFRKWVFSGFNLSVAIAVKLGLDGDKMRRICNRMTDSFVPSKKKINVLSHADLWSNNIMFACEGGLKSILVDFQLVRYCPLTHDVFFLLYLCSTREFREEHEGMLMKHYYETLCETLRNNKMSCVPGWDEVGSDVEEMRLSLATLSMLYFPTSTLNGVQCADLFSDDEQLFEYICVDRIGDTFRLMDKDSDYAERIVKAVKEVYELGTKLKI